MFTRSPSMNTRSSTRTRISPTKRARTEVVLAISADGRAQAKATAVHEPDPPPVIEEEDRVSSGYDSFEESDSSLDADAPRGMAPDGSEYLAFRRRRRTCSGGGGGGGSGSSMMRGSDPFPQRPKPSSSVAVPRTPKRRRHTSFTAYTGARTRMEPPLSRLPTPLKSSPPSVVWPVRRPHSSITPQRQSYVAADEEDGSEAETVMDEPIELPPRQEDDTDGDALTALKKLLARSRRGDVSLVGTSISARPSSAAMSLAFSFRSRSDTFNSTSSSNLPSFVETPHRKTRRRPLADGGFHGRQNIGNTSPTTVTDPNYYSDRDISDAGDVSGETRCICGRQDDSGKTMVECDSCKYWLHIKCLGYDRRALPKVFICTYCAQVTRQTKSRTRR